MRRTSCRPTFVASGSRLRRTVLACVLSTLSPVAFGQTALTTAQIAAKVSPSVVVIQGKTDSGEVLGSGFIVSKDGKIVTNLHVIRDMKTASVHVSSRPIGRGWSIEGKVFDSVFVLATDETKDLAIIEIPDVDLPVLGLGNSDTLTVGEPVVVVGSPLGLEATVTAGILSAIRDSGEGFKVLQTDAAINHGNSGGPLVAANGLAVGVVSSILRSDSAQGLNFAIPINYVRGLMTTLHDPMTLDQMRNSLTSKASAETQANSPTLQETLAWLRDTMPLGFMQTVYQQTNDGSTSSHTSQATAWSLESCTVTVGTQFTITTPNTSGVFYSGISSRNTFSLATLTEAAVARSDLALSAKQAGQLTYRSGDRWVYAMTVTSKSLEMMRYVSSDDMSFAPKTERVAQLTLYFVDETVANRVSEAFTNAANLCRGKKEPF
jgi:hypothetical protein